MKIRILNFIAISFLSTSAFGASNYQVNNGANQDITEWSTCKNVANAHASGKAIMVPTNSSTE